MQNSILFLIICLFGFNSIAKADSPLTSTDIASAYSNEKIIMSLELANGELTDELMQYLSSKSNPISLKIALINKLGWNIDGKSNAEVFWKYLQKNNKFKSLEDFKKKATSELLICYAYLKALDNYFNVDEAMALAQIAVKRDKKASYTINIICGLIEAQYYFNGNWCMLWKSTNKVRINKKLNVDLAPEAIKNIFEYMDLYKGEC